MVVVSFWAMSRNLHKGTEESSIFLMQYALSPALGLNPQHPACEVRLLPAS